MPALVATGSRVGLPCPGVITIYGGHARPLHRYGLSPHGCPQIVVNFPRVTHMSAVTVVRPPTHRRSAGAHRQVAAAHRRHRGRKQRPASRISGIRTVGPTCSNYRSIYCSTALLHDVEIRSASRRPAVPMRIPPASMPQLPAVMPRVLA